MKSILLTGALALCVVTPSLAESNPKVNKLLAKLSLDEKIGQMVQLDLMTVTVKGSSPIKLDETKLREAVVNYGVGSFINNGLGRALSIEEWTYVNKTIQDLIRAETPNKIPLLYGIDSIHGATFVMDSTLFPQQIAMAATRNPVLMQRSAEISAAETRAAGLRWTFAPVLDVGRHPVWARFPETFGEDPYLATVFGVAAVRGFEGADLSSPTSVAACLKHYIGYSFPLTGKDRSPALMSDSYLREYFLPPFRAAVKAGARTVMVNSGEVNGVPVHGSKYLLTDVLRGELGFTGVIVSDWEDVIRLHTWHKTADSPIEAVRQAVDAGLDMSMVPLDYTFFILLKQLVKEGKVSEKRINESVRRILQLKADVGLFKNPYIEPETVGQFGKPEYQSVALAAAEESITLLKNEQNILPLAKSTKLLVTGPAATSISALHGCWSYTWQGADENVYPKGALTVAAALEQKLGAANVTTHRGVDFDGQNVDADTALAAATSAEVVILCLGEDAYAETPGDINDFNLPIGQQEFAKRLYATGKPVVIVLVEGRGRVMREIESGAKGIMLAYWPGAGGAQAIANILVGDTNPSGKLPFTYARHANNLLTYDRKYTSMVAEISAPGDTKVNPAKPQWEFGHGLSYTTFETKNLKLSSPQLKSGGVLTVTVEVTNTGQRTGKEVVELYTSDLYASLTPAGKRLRAFAKIELQPGETKPVQFELRAADLAFVNAAGKTVTEPGEFEVLVGGLKAKFAYYR
ncbi:MAG: glycoside hydrolase family 3 N-terminal domain-containing protein [Verrucomicrobiota bacterium]